MILRRNRAPGKLVTVPISPSRIPPEYPGCPAFQTLPRVELQRLAPTECDAACAGCRAERTSIRE
jgi:hypothetical protein